ncbi:hypothetical protein JCM3766R1_002864 [Sporobolomyces carnicolor]
MLLLQTLAAVCATSAATAAVVPRSSTEPEPVGSLVKRSRCAHGLEPYMDYNDSKLLCLDRSATRLGPGKAITSVDESALGSITDVIVSAILAKTKGTISTQFGPGDRFARRTIDDVEQSGQTSFIVGNSEVEVPFARGSQGETTVNILDLLATSSALDTRASSNAVTGGSAIFDANGALDTFTIDYSFAAHDSTTGLSKRAASTLHTTYWANKGHSSTSLGESDLKQLVMDSYKQLPDAYDEVCGYMANSGSWHGAFRHWTGDYGYTIGECERARKF